MRRLSVYKKSYSVKGHYSHTRSGKRIWVPRHKVGSSRFKIKDRGNPGRGKKVFPKLKHNALGGKGFFNKPLKAQKRIVFDVAHIKGERTAIGRLAILQGFFKNTNPSYSSRARQLRNLVAGSFEGKVKVPYPTGFSRRRR